MDAELALFFPQSARDAREIAYWSAMKKRTKALLDKILGEDTQAVITEVDSYLLQLFPPKNFAGSAGAEVEFVRAFETACFAIAQKQGKDPKQMKTLEFLQTLELLKQQAKEIAKRK